MVKKIHWTVITIVAAFAIASCSDSSFHELKIEEPVYPVDFKQSALGGLSIDTLQNWNTAKLCQIFATVSLNSSQNFTIKAFTKNPLYEDAQFLGSSSVQAGLVSMLELMKPNGCDKLYMACYDRNNKMVVHAVDVPDSTAEVTFGSLLEYSISMVGGTYVQGDFFKESASNYTGTLLDSISRQFVNLVYINDTLYVRPEGDKYLIPSGRSYNTNSFNFSSAITDEVLLVQGTWNVNDDVTIGAGQTLIVSGGTVNLNADLVSNGKIIITDRGRLNVRKGHVLAAESGTFYNDANISLDSCALQTGSVHFYNSGTISGANSWLTATSSEIVNTGYITLESAKDTGNSLLFSFSNAGRAVIKNASFSRYVGCNASLLDCGEGSLTTAGTFYLGAKAEIYTGRWNNQNGYIFGSTYANGFSIFRFANEQFSSTGSFGTSGLVYFDGKLPSGYDDIEKSIKYTCTAATVESYHQINRSGFNNRGFNASSARDTDLKGTTIHNSVTGFPGYYYYAFEDPVGSGDFDFNDVVLRLSIPSDGYISIYACALGTTDEVTLFYEGQQIGNELHSEMGVPSDETVNTERTVDESKFKLIANIKASYQNAVGLPLTVKFRHEKGITEVGYNGTGNEPMLIYVNSDGEGKWRWPTEGTSITTAYPGFVKWAHDVNSDPDWYQSPSGNVVTW